MKPRLIRVFEHERLTLHPNGVNDSLQQGELEKLYEFNDRHNNKYFIGIRDGVKFKSFVGVIQVGSLTIEILPKADNKLNPSVHDYDKWRNALLSMLAICRYIKVDSVSEANLNKRYRSLLDLYFEIFLDEVSALIRRGLIKKYHYQKSNVNALKGRIVFNKHIQLNLIHQERLYTDHQVYDYDHLVNQILLKALIILPRVTSNTNIIERVSRLKLEFPEINEINIEQSHFDQLKDSRKIHSYAEALKISKMIILNYSPDIKNGQDNMLTLLFDMNKLWEEYIYRMLQRAKLENIEVSYQNSKKFWENKHIRPDLVLTKTFNESKETFIIDTKWKIVDSSNPSDDDLKQMYAYNLYWNSAKSILLYPKITDGFETFGSFHQGRKGENKCKLAFIDVLDASGKIDLSIGNSILGKLDIA